MEFDGITSVNSGSTPSLLGIPREKTLSSMGPLSVKSNFTRWIAPVKIEISSVRYTVAIASSGDVIRAELKKNGVKVSSIELSEGQYSGVDSSVLDISGLSGDVYTLDITNVGSITTGAHLQVQVAYKTVE